MKNLLLFCLALLLSGAAIAQEIFEATLSGRQEVYAVATSGTGNITAELTGNTLVVSGIFSKMSSPFDATVAGGAHLHIAPAGRNGGIAFNLTPILDPDLLGGVFVAATNTFVLSNEQVNQLRAGDFYVNIHTLANGGGELRGQLFPQSDAYYWANLFGNNEVPAIMTEAYGALAFTVTGDQLVATGTFSNLSSALASQIAGGVHLHIASAGSNGDVAIILNPTVEADGLSGTFLATNNTFTLTSEQQTALESGNMYVNIHSANFQGGELRGQVLAPGRTVFRAHLAAANEIPLTTSLASGQLLLTMTDNELIVTGRFGGLEGDIATDIVGGIHLHSAVAGTNGGVEIPLTIDIDADNRGATVEAISNTYPLTPDIEEALLNRGFYVNIHTLANPAGEIRGQVLPECQYVLTAPLTGTQEIPDVSTSAYGMIKLEVSGDRAIASGSFRNLSSALNVAIAGGAHIHTGLPGQTGDVVFLLAPVTDLDLLNGVFRPAANTFTVDADQRAMLRARGMYVNVHSLLNAGGELRGNLMGESANYFFAPLSGVSEAVPVNTAARGMIAMEANAGASVAVGSFANLSSPLATAVAGGAHLHTGFAGQGGPILQLLNVDEPGTSGVFSAVNNRFQLSSGALDTLRERMVYVNIHSTENTGGEIRGQVLPSAQSFFHTTLDGINETMPLAVSGLGGLKLELRDTTLIVTGSFANLAGAFDANIAGGAHLHLAGVGNNGDIAFPLNATLASDNLSGFFTAADNTLELTTEQVASLRADNYYANIHTAAQASGELRGQILPEVNFFPQAGDLLLPTEGALIDIVGEITTAFTVTWLPGTDVDNDSLGYVWQLATDLAFENVIFSTATADETFFATTFGTVDLLLGANGVEVGSNVTLYHRVVVTDGSNADASLPRSVNLNRGLVTGIDQVLAQSVQMNVFPTQTTNDPITVEITSDENRDATLHLTNALGQSLQSIPTGLINGETRFTIDLNRLPAGRYFLVLSSEGQTLPVKSVFKL